MAKYLDPAAGAFVSSDLMRNPSWLRAGEDLVTFYMTPGYQTWDPSWITFFSFAVFFGMILSDAGYAAILALAFTIDVEQDGTFVLGQPYASLAFVGGDGFAGFRRVGRQLFWHHSR